MNWFKSAETLPGNNDEYLVYTHAKEFKILWWNGKVFYRFEYDTYLDRSDRIELGPFGAPYWCYLEAPK